MPHSVELYTHKTVQFLPTNNQDQWQQFNITISDENEVDRFPATALCSS